MSLEEQQKQEGSLNSPRNRREQVAKRESDLADKVEKRAFWLLATVKNIPDASRRGQLSERIKEVRDVSKRKLGLLAKGAIFALALSATTSAFAQQSEAEKGSGDQISAEQLDHMNKTIDAAKELTPVLTQERASDVKDELSTPENAKTTIQEKVDSALTLATETPLLSNVVSKVAPGIQTVDGINKLQKAMQKGEGEVKATFDVVTTLPKVSKRVGPLLSTLSHLNELREAVAKGTATPKEVFSQFAKIILDAHTFGIASIVIDLIKNNTSAPEETKQLAKAEEKSEEAITIAHDETEGGKSMLY